MMTPRKLPINRMASRLDQGEELLHPPGAVLLVERGQSAQHLRKLPRLLADPEQIVAGRGERAPLLERRRERGSAAHIAGDLLQRRFAARDAHAPRRETERIHEIHPAGQHGAHHGRPLRGIHLGEPTAEERQGGQNVTDPLLDAPLSKQCRTKDGGGGERPGKPPPVLVEPHAGTQHRLGEKRQLVPVIEQVGELRHDEDEDQQHRRDAGHDEDRRIDQRASHLRRHPLVVAHLLDRLAQRLGQPPAQFARFHQVVDILGQRKLACVERLPEALPAHEGLSHGLESGGERRMVAAAALRQHRIAERDAGFEQRRELVKRDHQLLQAQPAAECGTRGRTPLVHLDHRMALGAQASNQLRDGAGLRLPFHEPAVPIDDFVLELLHRRSLRKREARHVGRVGRRRDPTVTPQA